MGVHFDQGCNEVEQIRAGMEEAGLIVDRRWFLCMPWESAESGILYSILSPTTVQSAHGG